MTERDAAGAALPGFAAVQWGAREHYGAPLALERAGLLHCLYTDWHAGHPLARIAAHAPRRDLLRSGRARRLPAEIPTERVRAFPVLNLLQSIAHRRDPRTRFEARRARDQGVGSHGLGRRLVAASFDGAGGLLVHPCTATDAVEEAAREGLFVAISTVSHPDHKLIEREEYLRFGRTPPFDRALLEDNVAFFLEELAHADLVLAASRHVADGLSGRGVSAARIAVVPYGLEQDRREPRTEPGRVLYLGKIGYLKGVPYLAEAARMLARRRVPCRVVAIGASEESLTARPEFAGVDYLGALPRDRVADELARADLLVLPTLSDGFGMVILEALAQGVPVVCTTECADLVVDGEHGAVVAPRDGAALAERIEALVVDRALRARMAAAAQRRAAACSIDAYARDLRAAIAARVHAPPTTAPTTPRLAAGAR